MTLCGLVVSDFFQFSKVERSRSGRRKLIKLVKRLDVYRLNGVPVSPEYFQMISAECPLVLTRKMLITAGHVLH